MKPRALPIALLATFMFLFLWSGGVASARQDEDAAAIDTFIARQAHRERGEEYREARKVVVGDLTHDGAPETVVLYTIEGQGGRNLYVQYLAVFTLQKGKLSARTRTDVGGKSVRSVELTSVEDDAILLETMGYAPKDASCCPSVSGATRYVLSGRTLREQKQGASQERQNHLQPTPPQLASYARCTAPHVACHLCKSKTKSRSIKRKRNRVNL